MERIKDKKITNILFWVERQSHYGLKFIFQFDGEYLFFDSAKFILSADSSLFEKYPWKKITWYDLQDEPSITRMRENELTSYFLEFSNGDIFFINETINGDEFWYQDFEIVSKGDSKKYSEVLEYMNEDFVEDGKLFLDSSPVTTEKHMSKWQSLTNFFKPGKKF